MIKTRKMKVKSIENEEIIMAMTITKTIITKIIITQWWEWEWKLVIV